MAGSIRSSQPRVSVVGDTVSSHRWPSFFKLTLGAAVAWWVPAASHARAACILQLPLGQLLYHLFCQTVQML